MSWEYSDGLCLAVKGRKKRGKGKYIQAGVRGRMALGMKGTDSDEGGVAAQFFGIGLLATCRVE